MEKKNKIYTAVGVAAVVSIGAGVAAYKHITAIDEDKLPQVFENPIEETILTPEEKEQLMQEEEKIHTDEGAVELTEGALEEKPENDTPEIDAESLELQKVAEDEFIEVYKEQQAQLESGELVIGEKTDIENGVIAKEDIIEYSEKDDVLPEVNYTTEKAIKDIIEVLGPGGASYWTIEGHYDEKDWEQMINNPYSSKALSVFFDSYKKYGDIETFKGDIAGWLRNGGDDGVAHMEVFG